MTCTHGLNMDTTCVKCALANGTGVPFDESLPPVQSGTHAPSSLISDLNASVDPKDPRSPLSGEELETLRYQMRGSTLERHRLIATVDAVAARERARIRAIVMRLMGNEWSANQLLEEIGE